ncbi:MAG: ankyrin repeat domain-containing protein [Sedimentisphaerales bacterium]|jgi:hypothetical protein
MKRILFSIVCVSIISTAFAEPNVPDVNAQLIQAAKAGDLAAVQKSLDSGANINAKRSSDGTTALIWAALNGRKEVVQLLLDKGADANTASNDGLTALKAAKYAGNSDIILMLDKTAVLTAPPAPAKKDVTPIQPAKDSNVPAVQIAPAKDDAKPAANEISSPNNITFKSAEPAPDKFDAWSFRWITPAIDPDAKLWYVVIQPDGQEYFRYDLAASAANRNMRSDFKAGFSGGDPRIFFKEHIRFIVHVSKGKMVFPPAGSVRFKFEFFQNNAEGKIDWKNPFKTIDAVSDLPASVSGEDKKSPITEKAITFKSAEKAPADFAAWCFEGISPTEEPNAIFWLMPIEPNGHNNKEIKFSNSGKNRYFKMYFKPGSLGGDARVFLNEYISLRIRPDHGNAQLSQSDAARCKFQFFRKKPDGSMNWNPFKIIDAVIEP